MDLKRYPRPSLAVDLVILTLGRPGRTDPAGGGPRLGVVVQSQEDGGLVLPGRFVRERHTVIDTVRELLTEKLHFEPRRIPYLELVGVYDHPDRDPRGWAISIAHTTTLRPDEAATLSPDVVEILPVHGPAAKGNRVTPASLAYDHDSMVTTAVRRARRRYERSPDPLRLARAPYTLSHLRHVHEAVLDESLKRDTFNRRMQPFLTPAHDARGETLTSDTGGRPAQMFRPLTGKDRDPEAGPFPLPRTR
jgi:ADP-ribose pyrophosphatase YjhB (NUDIX family)